MGQDLLRKRMIPILNEYKANGMTFTAHEVQAKLKMGKFQPSVNEVSLCLRSLAKVVGWTHCNGCGQVYNTRVYKYE